jgi:hypothetical protein
MPYKTYEPVSEKEITKTRWQGHKSICQTLRDIYALSDNEEAKLKCRVAMAMAKAMHNKLKRYKQEKQNAQ